MHEPIGTIAFPGSTQLALQHGALHGVLTLPAHPPAVIVLARAGVPAAADDTALASALANAGFGTLTLDLLAQPEERFADLPHNVSLLTRRLLGGLALLKEKMLLGELPALPIGLCGAGDCSPALLRVAALRDRDIYACVCRDGLIDLAGMLYLHSLASPLLVLALDPDQCVAASNRRALREVGCAKELRELRSLPETAQSSAGDANEFFELVAREAVQWFVRHLPAPTPVTKPQFSP